MSPSDWLPLLLCRLSTADTASKTYTVCCPPTKCPCSLHFRSFSWHTAGWQLHPTSSWACLQTKDRVGVARGETAEEFEDNLSLVVGNATALQQDHPQWQHDGIRYSFDNAAFHTRAHLPFALEERLAIPPRSPDIHRVAEHPFHAVKSAFRAAFGRRRRVKSVKQAMRLLEDIVHEVITPESVAADCAGLRATLASIIKNGGDWADPGLR